MAKTTEPKPSDCPTCGTPCEITWSGLELVENTGDETLATKGYRPIADLSRLREELAGKEKEIERLKRLQDHAPELLEAAMEALKQIDIARDFNKITTSLEFSADKLESAIRKCTEEPAPSPGNNN